MSDYPEYATVADYRSRFLLAVDGSEDPLDLALGLREASLLMDRTLQVQASWMIENYDPVTAEDYREAVLEQVSYWVEIAGGEEIVDLSQNTLRPAGGYSRVGSISIPQFFPIAPKAIEVLQVKGLWFPNPQSMAYAVFD